MSTARSREPRKTNQGQHSMHPQAVDVQVVIRAQHGDRAAFSDIASTMAGRLYALAFRIIRDHDRADDATQLTIVRIWRELPRLREPDRFDAWAYRILVNACCAEVRRAKRIHEIPGFGDEPMAPDDAITVADRDQLERGFGRLPAEQRAVLVLQHYLDLDLTEIAEMLGVPLGTVKSRSHAARRAMRAALDADARIVEGAQLV
jgi:RNA polymerase sigma-70 factor (ECF subfamily)